MLEFHSYTPLFVLVIACELILGLYVMMRDCKSPTNRVFGQYIGLAALCGVMDLLLMGLTDEGEALLAGRIWMFFLVTQMGVGYYLSMVVPYDIRKIKDREWINILIVLIIAACMAFMVNDMTWGGSGSGWYPTYSWHVLAVPIGLILFILLMVYNAFRRRSQLTDRTMRLQVTLLTSALTIPADLTLTIIFLRYADIYLPRLFCLGFVATIVLIIIGVLRYNVFKPQRTEETIAPPSHPRTVDLKMGHAYLFESPSSDRMFSALLHEMGTGTSALIICPHEPRPVEGPVSSDQDTDSMVGGDTGSGPDRSHQPADAFPYGHRLREPRPFHRGHRRYRVSDHQQRPQQGG